MKFTNLKKTSAAVILGLAATTASAAGFGVTGITGDWEDPTPGNISNLNINNVANGTDTVSWGNGNSSNSSYTFTPVTSVNPVPLDIAVALGDFVHNNFPISGFALQSVNYAMSFLTNSVPSSLDALLAFNHEETTNSAGTCSYPSVTPCADKVTVALASGAAGANFTEGGEDYYFELLGFSTDGGLTYDTSYITQENASNAATLYGKVTQVPAPAGLLLLGVAMAGLRFSSKRKAK